MAKDKRTHDRILVIGDIHGARRALEEVLQLSEYDRRNDHLVFLGDLVDGWPESREVIDFVLNLKRSNSNRVHLIRGNHDEWLTRFLAAAIDDLIEYKDPEAASKFNPTWWNQGGEATYNSYDWNDKDQFTEHYELLCSQKNALMFPDIRYLFVHGGWDKDLGFEATAKLDKHQLYWDREIWKSACMSEFYARIYNQVRRSVHIGYDKIFIGHSDVAYLSNIFEEAAQRKPVKALNMYNVDTGAGYDGKLTIMDVETLQFWQSTKVKDLYPDCEGRGNFEGRMILTRAHA